MDRSTLFANGLTLRGPQKWFFSTRSGVFMLNLTKSGFLRHCGLSPHFITSLLTTVNLMALKLPLWWYLFRYYYFYFSFSRFLTLVGPSQRIFIVALRSSWYVTTNKLQCETLWNRILAKQAVRKGRRLLDVEAIEQHGWRSERRTLLEEIRDHIRTTFRTNTSNVDELKVADCTEID